MNCYVPESVAEDDSGIFPFFFMRRNADQTEEDLAELIWQKGPVLRRRASEAPSAFPSRADPSVWPYSGATPVAGTELFMEEDEMAAWLDYTLGEDEGAGDVVGGVVGDHLPEKIPAAGGVQALDRGSQVPEADVGGWAPASGRPPPPPEVEGKLSLIHRASWEPNAAAARDSAVVGSSMTPWLLARGHAPESRTSSGDGGGGTGTFEHGHTSSSGGICEGDATVKAAPRREDRKRKAPEGDDSDCHSEDAEFESSDLKVEESRRSGSKRRSRAAEVHNLSERRRRDRINEKMKALQQLIPRCNKSDKASMLDDAIEYLKSLQLQVHMMSVGCSMVPMMFPGMQQYVPSMGMAAIPMGMRLGMGMGMDMAGAGALNHQMAASFLAPAVMSGAAAPLGTGAPMQPFHAPGAGSFSDPVKLRAAGQVDPAAACPAAAAAPAGAAQAPADHSNPRQHGFHRSSQVHPRTTQFSHTGSSNHRTRERQKRQHIREARHWYF